MSDTYKNGSEGSRICSSNIKSYDNINPMLPEYSPSETAMPFEVTPSAYITPTHTEQIRRENNRRRDRRKRFGVITSPIAVDTNSDAEQNAEKLSGKKD